MKVEENNKSKFAWMDGYITLSRKEHRLDFDETWQMDRIENLDFRM